MNKAIKVFVKIEDKIHKRVFEPSPVEKPDKTPFVIGEE